LMIDSLGEWFDVFPVSISNEFDTLPIDKPGPPPCLCQALNDAVFCNGFPATSPTDNQQVCVFLRVPYCLVVVVSDPERDKELFIGLVVSQKWGVFCGWHHHIW